jgi:hypothetical protein
MRRAGSTDAARWRSEPHRQAERRVTIEQSYDPEGSNGTDEKLDDTDRRGGDRVARAVAGDRRRADPGRTGDTARR